ncbi:unnamed protein product [Bursaphelenchus xylophilus]|uniref:(pine wood nematode) hypothetical protein n=1 Tax=Bursaphelenchus xylophilus TaxID=6326 RepID=A0A1I7S402_BURXY|nr:unnamed protein product [Bursaphelenchus xylophilus]CAG9116598.1 unnamed protein product [Bursaphelenchus xylophilus]
MRRNDDKKPLGTREVGDKFEDDKDQPKRADQMPSWCRLEALETPPLPRQSSVIRATDPATTDIISRVDRSRALRKSAAIEDEDQDHQLQQVVQPPPAQPVQSSQSLSVVPSQPLVSLTQQPLASDDYSKLAAAVAAMQNANNQVNGGLSANPNPGGITSMTDLSSNALSLLCGVKQESPYTSKDDLMAMVSNSEFLNQPNNWLLNKALTLGAIANSDISAEEALRQEERKLFDPNRHPSTESTASTSSSIPLAEQNIPRKQEIQNDIRHNKGRFELVRKRGRSDVWNLFGQVVDKQTGNRLPYVACYACKVLYTDTGGGTGNMTRHRCSMGSSYRSSFPRSETQDQSGTQSSSFESVHGFGPNSPDVQEQNDPQHSTTAAREAFAYQGYHGSLGSSLGSTGYTSSGLSHSSTSIESLPEHHRGFFRSHSAGHSSTTTTTTSNTTGLLHPNAAVPPLQRAGSAVGVANLGIGGSGISTNLGGSRSNVTTPTLLQQCQHLTPSQKPVKAPTRPGSSQQLRATTPVPPVVVTGAGYVFTQADKQLFAQAVLKFCAQDMHNSDVVAGEGFKNLIETVLFIGRRSHGDNHVSNSFDPVRNLIPSAQQMREVVMAQDDAIRAATKQDMDQLKDIGISLLGQIIKFGDEQFISIMANYITDEWQITQRPLKVRACQSPSMEDFMGLLQEVMHEYNLFDARQILLTLCSEIDDEKEINGLPSNVRVIRNVVRALNGIVNECFEQAPDLDIVQETIRTCNSVLDYLIQKNLFIDEIPACLMTRELNESALLMTDNLSELYLTLKFVRENVGKIAKTLELLSANQLFEKMKTTDWAFVEKVEVFLESYYDTFKEFGEDKDLTFQAIVPNFFNLLDEYEQVDGDDIQINDDLNKNMKKELDWGRAIRKNAEEKLKEWVNKHLTKEHYMSTVLNPKIRSLQLICTDMQKINIYSSIKDVSGLNKMKRERDSTRSDDGEPARKRRNFLSKLEDCAMEDDELECYLRTPFGQSKIRSLLEFWSTFGETNFPKLSKFGRFILGVHSASRPLKINLPSTKLSAEQIGTFLKLRPEVSSTVSRPLPRI